MQKNLRKVGQYINLMLDWINASNSSINLSSKYRFLYKSTLGYTYLNLYNRKNRISVLESSADIVS